MEEKKERTHVLDGISPGLPALMRAYKLHSKASKVGFDWPDTARRLGEGSGRTART
ncbi:MAG: hypothetical protein LUF79_04035 [Enterococcus sp.]|nr:hypothetical protein [Enterococcus sp.]